MARQTIAQQVQAEVQRQQQVAKDILEQQIAEKADNFDWEAAIRRIAAEEALKPPSLEKRLAQAVEHSLFKLLSGGEWVKIDYASRVQLPGSELQKMYAAVDMEKVRARVTSKIEEMIADKILHAMATEVSTDVKKILCDKKLRSEIRATVLAKIQEAATAVTE